MTEGILTAKKAPPTVAPERRPLRLVCPECGNNIEGEGWISDIFPQKFCSQPCIREYHAKHAHPPAGLTSAEIGVVQGCGVIFTAFTALPQTHPSDAREVAMHIHAIQNIVMARAAQRAHPDEFPTIERKDPDAGS